MTTLQEVLVDRNILKRVIALINQKGGVGKSSCVANLAVEYARAGWKVLVVELDPQGNLGMEFGYRPSSIGHAEADPRDDYGTALATALTLGTPLSVTLPDVRSYPNGGKIDVIPAGVKLKPVPVALGVYAAVMKQPYEQKLAQLLMPLAGDYHVVLIDCPPADMVLRSLALHAARYVLAPTKSDPASWEDGLNSLIDEINAARPDNPSLQMLGVILFDLTASAPKLNKATRSEVTDIINRKMIEDPFGVPPVFTASIRHAEAPAKESRVQGRTMSEIAVTDLSGPSHVEILRRQKDGEDVSGLISRKAPGSTANVAGDYAALAVEAIKEIWKNEAAAQGNSPAATSQSETETTP